jgi:transcriptional regulator GlxA family with amidase domain
LLETTFLRVKEIAASVGYRNVAQLDRDFKKAFGVTPLQHRRRFFRRMARTRTHGGKTVK